MTPIDEAAARAALRADNSEASNPDYYEAVRRDGGWLFGWRRERGRPPVGTHSWVVADSGRVRMLGYRDLPDEAIAAAAAED